MAEFMSVMELLSRISIGRQYKASGNLYCVSPTVYKKMGEAIDHYLETGEIFVNQWGELEERKIEDANG